MAEGLSLTPEEMGEETEKKERSTEDILKEMNTNSDSWQNPDHHN